MVVIFAPLFRRYVCYAPLSPAGGKECAARDKAVKLGGRPIGACRARLRCPWRPPGRPPDALSSASQQQDPFLSSYNFGFICCPFFQILFSEI